MHDDPFAEGVAAAANEGSLNDNRYPPGSAEHTAWEEGFMQQSRDAGDGTGAAEGAVA